MIAVLNAALARLVDGALRPFEETPLAGLAVVSLISAIGMLLVVRATSNQARVAAVKRAIQACVFEIRLFNDDAGAMLRSLGELLRHHLTYLRLAMVPVLWMVGPCGLLLGHLHAHYGYDGLAIGQQAIVAVRLSDPAHTTRPQARLVAPPGIRIETPAVWAPAIREVAWRVAAETSGDYALTVHVGEHEFTKLVRVSNGVVRRAPVRPNGMVLNQILHPGEPPLPEDAAVESIAVTYPRRSVRVLGREMHWMVVYLVLSTVFALALRRRLRVVL